MPPLTLQAPPLASFARYPAAWYGCGPLRGLERRPRAVLVGGEELALFAGPAGLGAIGRRCAHFGADLARGDIEGGTLRCPFHGWRWDTSGRCRGAATGPSPEAATLGLPTAQAGGVAFAFAGPEPSFPLPWFPGGAAGALVCGGRFRLELDAPWFVVGANAFDASHLGLVHGRRLLGLPETDQPEPFCRRSRYRARVMGARPLDRVLALLAGSDVQVAISVWAGTLVLVEARFARVVSRVLICIQPLPEWRCALEVYTVVSRRGPARALAALRARFVRAFVGADVGRLSNLGYQPGLLLEADRPLVDYLAWAARLPPAEAHPTRRLAQGG